MKKEVSTEAERRQHAVFYGEVDPNTGEFEDKMFELFGVTATNIKYSTDDHGEWEWAVDEKKKEAVQASCPATTKEGNPCPGTPKDEYGEYCYNHRNQAQAD